MPIMGIPKDKEDNCPKESAQERFTISKGEIQKNENN